MKYPLLRLESIGLGIEWEGNKPNIRELVKGSLRTNESIFEDKQREVERKLRQNVEVGLIEGFGDREVK